MASCTFKSNNSAKISCDVLIFKFYFCRFFLLELRSGVAKLEEASSIIGHKRNNFNFLGI